MINRKIMFGIIALLAIGLIVLAGCSSNQGYDNYRYQQQQGNNKQYVGGGCGVTAPAQGADTGSFIESVSSAGDGL